MLLILVMGLSGCATGWKPSQQQLEALKVFGDYMQYQQMIIDQYNNPPRLYCWGMGYHRYCEVLR